MVSDLECSFSISLKRNYKVKNSIKNACQNIALKVIDKDRINKILNDLKNNDEISLKDGLKKVQSSLFSMLVPVSSEQCQKTDSDNESTTDKDAVKNEEYFCHDQINSACNQRLVNSDSLNDEHANLDNLNDENLSNDVLHKTYNSSLKNEDSYCKTDTNNIKKSSLFKRKDIMITSLNSQRVLRVSSTRELLDENIYFTKAIREFLKAPVNNLNFYLNSLFYDFASLVSVLPASASLHDSFEGGLLSHSLHTALKSSELIKQFRFNEKNISFNELEIVLIALLHDLAKIITDMSITDESSEYIYRPLFIRKSIFDSLREDIKQRLKDTYTFEINPFYKNILSITCDPVLLSEKLSKNPDDSMYFEFYPVSEFVKATKSDFLFVSFTKNRSMKHDDIFRFSLSCFVKTQISFIKKINRNKGLSLIHSVLKDDKCNEILELIKKADVYACFCSQQNNFGINCIENYLYEFIKADLLSHKDQGCYRLKNGYFIEYGSLAQKKLVRAFDCYYALNSKSVNLSDDFDNYKKVVDQINKLTHDGSLSDSNDVFKKDFTYHPFFRTLVDSSVLTQRLYKRSCTYTELTDRALNRFLVYGFFIRTDSFEGRKRNPEYVISFDILEKDVKTKLIPVLKNFFLKNIDKAKPLFTNDLFLSEIKLDDLKKQIDKLSFTYVPFKKGKSHLCLESLDENSLCSLIDTDKIRVNSLKNEREKESDIRYREKCKKTKVSQLDINLNIKAQACKEEQFLSDQNSENDVLPSDLMSF